MSFGLFCRAQTLLHAERLIRMRGDPGRDTWLFRLRRA